MPEIYNIINYGKEIRDNMDSIDYEFIINNLDEYPLSFFIRKFNCRVPDITGYLRRRGYIRDIDACELDYILNNMNDDNIKYIQEELYLTDTQLSQIRTRYKVAEKGLMPQNLSTYTKEQVAEKTRYIVEEVLQLELDDTLPRKIATDDFTKNKGREYGGYMLIKYANCNKQNDKCYKYFSAVAYLMEIAYPGVFKPYQFKLGTGTKEYFTKQKYISALIDVIENKLCIDLNNIETLVKCNGFLSKAELRFYGLSEHLYKHLFGNKQNMLDELVKVVSMNKSRNTIPYKSTNALKNLLIDDNVDITMCYIDNCECKGIEIHHIRAKRFGEFKSIDDVQNLIPLCPYHHDMVYPMTPKDLSQEMSKWRDDVINYIVEHENK